MCKELRTRCRATLPVCRCHAKGFIGENKKIQQRENTSQESVSYQKNMDLSGARHLYYAGLSV